MLFNKFIQQYSFKQQMSEKNKLELYTHLSIINLHKKHVLIKDGQLSDFAYFVIKGAARSFYLKNGTEVNTWFALENEIAGSMQNFKEKTSSETIELLENATLIAINIKTIKPLMLTNIEIANFIYAIIEEYALFLEEKMYWQQMATAMDKLDILIEKEPELLQRIPLTYIASFLGISRETLSRLRAK